MSEKNSFAKRAARYAKISASAVGVGVQLAVPKKADEKADLLRLALGGLKGPLMKVAQILGTIPDLVPPEYAEAFAQLQANAPSMGTAFVARRMRGELGADWEKKFQSFDKNAVAAASLGQVHKAVGLDGAPLACKLQYPDMASAAEADLKQLKLVLGLYEAWDKSVRTEDVQAELADRIREELDYVREAKHMRLFNLLLGDEKGAHVPRFYNDLSTDRLLTMSWLEGVSLTEAVKTRNQDERNAIALNLHRIWYAPFYTCGVLHGDPHPGNYTVCVDNSVNLMDFGCVRIFSPTLVGGIVTLYRALQKNDQDMAVEAYRAWGFTNPTKELVEILNMWAKFIYAPVLEDKVRPLHETNTGVYGKQTARKVHDALRKIGGVKVPREFVFIDRAAVGLGSVFLRLGAEVNWHRVFNGLVEGFDAARMEKHQKTLLKKVGLDLAPLPKS